MPIHAGTGFIDILPRVSTAAFTGAMNAQLKPAVGSFSSGLKSAFAPLAPILAGTAAVAIGKMTLSFEQAFTRIDALSNASEQQIAQWRNAVFALGRETAVPLKELTDGLFFLASAGLDADQIFPALEASATGAAIGLGEMADITTTVAQVLNAYPEAGLKAIDVIDALTAAVRESTAEPAEFAEALGRLLPIASKAEVGVEELVASLATLSNIGLDVDEGVTGVRQVLNLIVSPGKQATETMNELGIATEDLRQRLAEKGLINTLRFLEERVGGNEDQFRKLLPNIRAMTAAFGLTVQEAEKVDGIFRRVAQSSGDAGVALDATQAGPMFKFQQAMVALQSAAIRFGQLLLPLATQIAQAFTLILGPLTDLLALMTRIPGLTTAITFAFAGFAAVKFVPPLLLAIARGLGLLSLSKFGNLANDIAKTAFGIKYLGLAALRSAAPLALIPGAMFALAKVAGDRQTKAFAGLTDHIRDIGLEAAAADGSLIQLRKSVAAQHGVGFRLPTTTEQREAVRRDFEKLTGTLGDEARAQAIANTEIEEFQEQLKKAQPGLQGATRSLAAMTDQNFTEFSTELRGALAAGQVDITKWNAFVSKTMGKAGEAFADFKDDAFQNLNFVAGALGEMSSEATSAQQELAEGTEATGQALIDLREQAILTPQELLKAFKEATRQTKEFGRDLLTISNKGGAAGDRLSEVLLGMEEGGQAAADTIAQALRETPALGQALVNNFAAGEGAAEDLATRLTRRIVGTLEDIRDILEALGRAWGIEVDVEGDEEAESAVDGLLVKLREIDSFTATATVTTIFNRKKGTGFDPRQDGVGVAAGGILGAQHGMVVRRPTLLTGEGKYHTPFGKGAEAVLPLDDHTVGRLGASIARQIHLPMIVVEADGQVIGRVASREQRRRRQLVGA